MKHLTDNQKEILRLMRNGMRYQEIADYRCVSVKTVHNTVARIFKQLNAKNKTQAIRNAEICGELETNL